MYLGEGVLLSDYLVQKKIAQVPSRLNSYFMRAIKGLNNQNKMAPKNSKGKECAVTLSML